MLSKFRKKKKRMEYGQELYYPIEKNEQYYMLSPIAVLRQNKFLTKLM